MLDNNSKLSNISIYPITPTQVQELACIRDKIPGEYALKLDKLINDVRAAGIGQVTISEE